MSIIVNNVSKQFGKQWALKDVSFEVQKGEVVGFLGPNGAGKSTMMKIITCYQPPTDGDVSVCGLDIWNDSLALRKKIGYLSEANPLYVDMYVVEFLRFIAGMRGIPVAKRAKRVNEVIEMTGLTPEAHKKIVQLSKGYKQRVGIAQALISDPEVLILDEPTSGLDPNQLVGIRNLIKECGKTKTVLLSTHIMQEVEAMCSRAIIINKGQIVADASLDTLRQEAANRGVKGNSIEELFHTITRG
ncbi:MAG: ATP-binding cassette domain-containing protein [Bacteroidales bacterium]|nr:ATP-binding cassette domain-containing protein [Bacteroidales bacterium]